MGKYQKYLRSIKDRCRSIKKLLIVSFTSKKNISRDIFILLIAAAPLAWFVATHLQKNKVMEKIDVDLEQIENQIEKKPLDTSNWQNYRTQWYGFELKYPADWNKPILKNARIGSNAEYLYQFRKKNADEENLYIGFDVIVYNIARVKTLANTDELSKSKSSDRCSDINAYTTKNSSYPMEKIDLPRSECLDQTYFYSISRNEYIFNIVPISGKIDGSKEELSAREVDAVFPELSATAQTFNLIDIFRPKLKVITSRLRKTAPLPHAETKRDRFGRMICAKNNDHPSKSSTKRKTHMDMECCLDPDEYPNPNCYYDPKKYGKYL